MYTKNLECCVDKEAITKELCKSAYFRVADKTQICWSENLRLDINSYTIFTHYDRLLICNLAQLEGESII